MEVAIRAELSGDAPGALPPTVRALAISMPAAFTIGLAGTPSCGQEELELEGPAACPESPSR